MPRDRSLDSIFLHNFFKDRLEIFTLEQPKQDEMYLLLYDFATSDWYPLKNEIDTYPISKYLKDNLILLFEIAFEHHFYVGDKAFESKRKMRELWEKIRCLAKTIRSSAKTDLLYQESSLRRAYAHVKRAGFNYCG